MGKDYSLGKIYKIVADTEEEYKCYIGSTCRPLLSQRMSNHREKYKSWKNGTSKNYISSFTLFERFGVEKCRIVLIENYPCSSIDELTSRERYWFDTIENCNKMRPKRNDDDIPQHIEAYQNQKAKYPELLKTKYARKLELHPNLSKEEYQKYKNKKESTASQRVNCEFCGKEMRRDSRWRHNKNCRKEKK